jgi:hypothetical protein
MNEIIDTRGQFDSSLPDGERDFRVENIRKIEKGPTTLYVWELSFDGAGEQEWGEQVFLPSMMGNLLRLLGCEEISPKKFKWDPQLLVGRQFVATVSRHPDKKKPEVIRQEMDGFKKSDKESEIPF